MKTCKILAEYGVLAERPQQAMPNYRFKHPSPSGKPSLETLDIPPIEMTIIYKSCETLSNENGDSN